MISDPSDEETPDLPVRIGDNLTRVMDAKGIDARRLAALIGVDESAVSLWRAGRRVPRLAHIEAIARTLAVDAGELLGSPVTAQLRPDVALLAQVASQLPGQQVEALVMVARSMRTAMGGADAAPGSGA